MKNKAPEVIDVPTWVKRGSMLVRRSALSDNDPESEYNYIKKTYGVDPTLYGVESPAPKCPHCQRPMEESDENF